MTEGFSFTQGQTGLGTQDTAQCQLTLTKAGQTALNCTPPLIFDGNLLSYLRAGRTRNPRVQAGTQHFKGHRAPCNFTANIGTQNHRCPVSRKKTQWRHTTGCGDLFITRNPGHLGGKTREKAKTMDKTCIQQRQT